MNGTVDKDVRSMAVCLFFYFSGGYTIEMDCFSSSGAPFKFFGVHIFISSLCFLTVFV